MGDVVDEKTRDHYIEMAREQLLEFDKRILWLSAGALALTLAYVPSLNTTPSGVGVVLLLGGAITVVLVRETLGF